MATQPLTFRLATPSDAPSLASLVNRAFRAEKTGQTWLYDSQDKRVDIASIEFIEGMIKGPDSVMLVGTQSSSPSSSSSAPDPDPNTPLATCFLIKPKPPISNSSDTAPHRSPGAAWMGFLAVPPDSHRRGYGVAMLRELERFVVQEWGVKRLEFDFVSSRTGLRAWYEGKGYRATGKVRPFQYGEKGREILAPGLEMVVLAKDL